MSAKILCSVLIWPGFTPVILGTGLEKGLVQQFEIPCDAHARPNWQARICAVITCVSWTFPKICVWNGLHVSLETDSWLCLKSGVKPAWTRVSCHGRGLRTRFNSLVAGITFILLLYRKAILQCTFCICLIHQNKARSYVFGGMKGREQINGIFLMWLIVTCASHWCSLFIWPINGGQNSKEIFN